MGNSQNESDDFLDIYQEVRRQSDLVTIEDKKTKIQYLLRQFGFGDKKQYERQLQKYNSFLEEHQNQSILNVVKVFNKEFNNLCATTFKIYVVYEYPSVTLQEEIAARKKEDKYFDECELWAILQSCVNGLEDVKPTISLHPTSVFIVPDGLLKIINNDMIRQDYRCLISENYYYAPEKIEHFNEGESIESLKKQRIFSLGMTILSTALLRPVQNCYNFQKLEYYEDKVEVYLEEIVDRYSEEFIEAIVSMLEYEPTKRASLDQIKTVLSKVWNGEEQHHENCQGELNDEDYHHDQEESGVEEKVPQEQQEEEKYNQENIHELSQNESSQNIHQPFTQAETYVNSYKVSTQIHQQKISQPQILQQNQSGDKENLFTDPKLLEMIRNDLKSIRELKHTAMSVNDNSFRSSEPQSQLGSRIQLQ